ncbi:aminotransferase required for NaD biosynthesis [Methylocaldum marinum]|uniref:Aminotransferase required for NaD biosynthesis n=1 Tax=Methylocaldum marinum TaxID=1432792 RepID=A0A250KWP6_9GAMM|nr:aminotransferase required for NaD biosynthesis [Methylocaldum marinum]
MPDPIESVKETLNTPSLSGRGLGEGLLDQSVAKIASPNWRLNQGFHKESGPLNIDFVGTFQGVTV